MDEAVNQLKCAQAMHSYFDGRGSKTIDNAAMAGHIDGRGSNPMDNADMVQ